MFQSANSPDTVRHCHLPHSGSAALEYTPYLYLEARIDVADVRSGLQQTCSLSNAMEIMLMEGDAIWTQDMILPIDSDSLRPGKPPEGRLRSLPEIANAAFLSLSETQYFQYLLRYYSLRVLRNAAVNLFSAPNESHPAFVQRCIEMATGAFRKDLDALAEVFDRKLEQIKGKYSAGWEANDFERLRFSSQAQEVLYKASDRMTDLFLGAELTLDQRPVTSVSQLLGGVEIEERLFELESEARRAIDALINHYQEQVRNIDEYVVHPNLKDIHLVRSCILWIPSEVRAV